MEDSASFGYWLRRRRKALDLTQDALARRVGCAVSTIKKLEGEERRPSRELAARLANLLAIPPAEQEAFLHAARAEQISQAVTPDLPNAFPPLTGLKRPMSNLPVPLTPLVGRERALAEVGALLRRADVRLVTLTGTGGTGKTRLAIAAAAALCSNATLEDAGLFPHGVWFVDLAPLGDPQLVAVTIAQALGVHEQEGRATLTALKDYLRERQLLLLLDNFEQVAAAGPLLAELLAAAPRLRLLVTSRETLHLSGEYEYPVPPLALPDLSQVGDLTQLTQYEAVRLFVERAQAVQRTFAVTNANALAVAEICYRLDGLPLAIELAAARVKLFSPRLLLAKLDHPLHFLTVGARDLPARQRTIRTTIDWSYQLLDAAEQRLFARLSVFVGGFTIAAAEAVCGESAYPDMSNDVAGLFDKSMLQQGEELGDEPRFTMLETVREYGLERLQLSGEAEAIRRRHAHYFRAVAVAAARGVWSAEELRWRETLEAEAMNLLAALQWSLGTGDAELGAGIVIAVSDTWLLDRELKLHEWAERFLEKGEAVLAALRARLFGVVSGYRELTGEVTLARQLSEEGLAVARASGDKGVLGRQLLQLSHVVREIGDYARAEALAEEGLALYRELGDLPALMNGLRSRAHIAARQGQQAQCFAFAAEARAVCLRLGQPSGIAEGYNGLGEEARIRGDYAQAASLYEQSLVLHQAVSRRGAVDLWVLYNLGYARLRLGQVREAERCFREGLALMQERGMFHVDLAPGVAGMAGVLLNLGAPEDERRAAVLLGATQRLWEQSGASPQTADAADLGWLVATARARLGEEVFASAWAEGRALTAGEAFSESLRGGADLEGV